MEKEQWLAQRRECITVTDVPKILGQSSFGSPYTVWADKRGESFPVEESENMRMGVEMEPHIADRYAELHAVTLQDPGRYALIQNADRPWIACTPDRIYEDGSCGVECKLVIGRGRFWSPTEPDPHAWLQAHWCMIATGIPRWDVAAIINHGGRMEYAEYHLEADEELHKGIITRCEKFYENCMIGSLEPTADGSEYTLGLLKSRFPDASETLLEPDEKVTELAHEYDLAKTEYLTASEKKQKAQSRLIQKIGAEQGFESERLKVTYKAARPSMRLNKESLLIDLRKEIGDEKMDAMIERNTKLSGGGRRFYCRWKGENDG